MLSIPTERMGRLPTRMAGIAGIWNRMRTKWKPARSVIVLALASALGCDSYADIREGLGEVERTRFDRGVRAAVPCWSCHDITGSGIKVGPPLLGFMGTRAGTSSAYAYSEELRSAGVMWTPEALDAFLADPTGSIPGNRMVSPGIGDPTIRRDLIFFLRLATAPTRLSEPTARP